LVDKTIAPTREALVPENVMADVFWPAVRRVCSQNVVRGQVGGKAGEHVLDLRLADPEG